MGVYRKPLRAHYRKRRRTAHFASLAGRVGRLHVSHGGDNEVTMGVSLLPGVANVLFAKLPAAGETLAKLGVNGLPLHDLTIPSGANDQLGNLVVGARLDNGNPVSAGSINLTAAVFSYDSSDDVYTTLLETAREVLLPIVLPATASGTVSSDNTFDLATIIKDPSGAGYTLELLSAPLGVTASIVGTVLHFTSATAVNDAVDFRVTNQHPIVGQTIGEISLDITVGSERFPNGFAFAREGVINSIAGSANETFTRMVVPVQFSGTWAKSVANGGTFEYKDGILDVQFETYTGDIIPYAIDYYDPATGVGVLNLSIDWNPKTQFGCLMYYSSPITEDASDPSSVYLDYYDVYTPALGTVNPAAPGRPWTTNSIALTTGIYGPAADFVNTGAAVGQSDASHISGVDQLEVLAIIKRDSTSKDEGYIAIGDPSTDSTVQLTLRDDVSTTLTDNTIRGKMTVSDGTVTWRGTANLQNSSAFQTIHASWLKGEVLKVSIDGVEIDSTLTNNNPRSGTITLSGGISIGIGGNNSINGKWDDLIQLVRIGKKARSTGWRYVEEKLITENSFTLGAQLTNGELGNRLDLKVDKFSKANTSSGLSMLLDVLSNDDRTSSGTLTISTVATPTIGAAAIESNKIRFTAAAGAVGKSWFYYNVNDGLGNTGSVGVEVEIKPPTVAPPITVINDYFFNPFNKLSARHRPLSKNWTEGIAGGTRQANSSTYDADNTNTNDINNAMGRIGVIRCSNHPQGDTYKYFYRFNSTDQSSMITRRIAWNGKSTGVGFPGTNKYQDKVMPDYGYITVDGTEVTYPDAGDAEVLVYPDVGTNPKAFAFAEMRWTIPASNPWSKPPYNAQTESRFIKYQDLHGLDWGSAIEGEGASAISIFGHTLRRFEVAGSNPDPIWHTLCMGCTRKDGPPGSHLLAKKFLWPATNVDGGGNGADDPANNLGPFNYGQRIAIPFRFWDQHDSLVVGNLEHILWLQLCNYGLELIDGHGSYQNATHGICQIRVDKDLGFDATLKGKLDAFYAKIVNANILRPVCGVRKLNAESEVWTDNLPYYGGHGTNGPVGDDSGIYGAFNSAIELWY